MAEEGYVVKMMAYQDADGFPVRDLSKARLIKDRTLAETAAELCGGWVAPVLRPDKPTKVKGSKKAVKNNQAWMRRSSV